MRIELFGYYIYPPLIIAVIGTPLLIAGIIILVSFLKKRKRAYSTSTITTWEKKYLPKLLMAEKKETNDKEYKALLDDLLDYIEDCNYWNTDELLEIDRDAVFILTDVLFDNVKKVHLNNPDRAVLLLHAIDNINGGIDYSTGKDWMADDMSELKNHEKMGSDEAKLLALCESLIVQLDNEYIDEDSNKIPTFYDVYEELYGTTTEDVASALRDIEHCVDFRDLQDDTYELCENVLIDHIIKLLREQKQDYLDEYYKSYLRALASVIDRQLYDNILKTIDD